MTDSDVLALAQHALDLVGTDPRAALRAADDVLVEIRPRPSPEAAGTASRAAGLALRELGDLSGAETRLRAGVRAARTTPKTQAEARMSLALVLLDRGRTRAALRQAEYAAQALTGVDRARLTVQRGLVLQRCGRVAEALAAYGEALPVLRRAGDETWEARLLNNRGLLHAYAGSLRQARRDLERAKQLYDKPGQSLYVADAEWNLGFVAAVEGDVPEALERYHHAETYYLAEGLPVGRILLDRAAVLLQVGLVDEAREVMTRAVADLEASDAAADLAEGLVAAAQVALAQGDRGEAAHVARRAERLTVRQGRPTWTLRARQVAFLADHGTAEAPRQALVQGPRLAVLLRDAGWREEEQEVLLLCGEAAIRVGDLARAAQLLARASAIRHARANALRHRLWYLRALLREAQLQQSAALRAVLRGLASLDDQRALLGATELRAQVAGQAERLSRLGLRLAAAEGRPGRMLQVAELSRAGGLRLRPVRPPRDAEVSAALAELRQTVTAEQAGRMDDALSPAGRTPRVAQAEDTVRRLSRGVPGVLGASAAPVVAVSELLETLGERAFAEYVVIDDALHVVTAVDGWVRQHALGPLRAIDVEVDTLRFTMQRMTVAAAPRSARAFEAAASRLDGLLVRAAPELLGREVVVSPVAVLQGLPWACLPSLREVPLSVTPSATLWCRAVLAPPSVGAGVVFAAGPGLPAAQDEVLASSAAWPRSLVLTHGAATVAATLAALEGSSVAHIAAHGQLRRDNPLFSSLDLADGPLTVYDLERLDRAPSVVVLPACRSAVSTVRSGEELLGLAAAFLALGSRSVVASVIPVPDAATARFMPRLHGHLAAGQPMARALANAIAESEDGVEAATARSFLCLGSG